MRIGVTLQSLHHFGGIGIYTQQIVKQLLALDRTNEYILLYPSFGQAHRSIGHYCHYENVTEVLSWSLIPHGLFWDHLVVPRLAQRHGVDVLFNPFLSVPLFGGFRKVLVMHNSEWFTMPEVFWAMERILGRLRMQAVMRAADRIISVSDAVTDDCVQATGLPRSKFRTIYHGVGESFRVIQDRTALQKVAQKYRLPERFVLFVGGIYPQKNLRGLLRSFRLIMREVPHTLVVAGNARWNYEADLQLMSELHDRVLWLGWVDQADIPALYNLADCFVYPSFYEGFGICLVEAMACGCPVVAASTGALPEVAGKAALLVDPRHDLEMKEAILAVLQDYALRNRLVEQGMERARHFTWERCAAATLSVFDELAPTSV